MAAQRQRLLQWERKEPIPPVTLEIQPSERCNHHCPACQAQYSMSRVEARRRAKLGSFLDLNLIQTIWQAPPDGIVISGNTGDPLLHPDIDGLLNLLGERGIPTVVITNGQAITEGLAAVLVRTCTGIRVSLDAHDAHSSQLSHGTRTKDWYAVLLGISNLITAREEAGLTCGNCLIGVGYLTARNTVSGMKNGTRLARSLGVDYIQFRPFHHDQTPIDAELQECEREATPPQFRVMASDQKYRRFAAPIRNYKHCEAAWFYTVLDARGDLYLCCHHVGNPAARIGSLREQSWLEFITGDTRRSIIDTFSTQNCLPFCRLDSENELLAIAKKDGITVAKLTPEIERHRVFI